MKNDIFVEEYKFESLESDDYNDDSTLSSLTDDSIGKPQKVSVDAPPKRKPPTLDKVPHLSLDPLSRDRRFSLSMKYLYKLLQGHQQVLFRLFFCLLLSLLCYLINILLIYIILIINLIIMINYD